MGAPACSFLQNLTKVIVRPSALASILDGMRTHASSVGVQHLACEALVMLMSQDKQNIAKVMESDGFVPVLTAMTNHSSR